MIDKIPEFKKKDKKLGRPRDQESRKKTLESTLILLETRSLKDITIESIAAHAGVSKVTIYRWWSSKVLLVIDAFMEAHLVRTPMDQSLPPGGRLAKHIITLAEQYAGFPGQVVAQIIGEGQHTPAILREFRERFHYGRRAVVREVLEEWRQSGDISSDTNIEALMDLLYAPIYMRLLLRHAPLDQSFAFQHIISTYTILGVKIPDFIQETLEK